ncbi:MAG: hypothetical protein HDS91_00665 [Bacteroidales bacterium]|nr:hypothetical protein [Bacteroidales bacterium]
MLITIYDLNGIPKAELSPNDSSTQVKEIQGDSILTLSFTHYDHISLDVDDYVDFEGERFWLTEKYRPRQNARKEWVYDLKLYGVESMIKRLLVIKTVDGEDEPVFTLTAPPQEHVAMIVKCMNDGMGNITDWKVGQVNGTENIVIDYFGKYCDEALREIAEKVGAEWWVEGQTVNICKCEHGEPIPMGYNKGLLSIDPGTADNVKFYTRLYPVGSSRNIDREKYGYSRLQLPGGQKYVEINADKYGRVDHFEADAFADIYPRRTGIVSNVRSEVKTGEDGTPFTIYYFSDNSLPFDPNAYEIGGLVKRVSFQEGSELAGLGEEDNGTYYFEVNFNSRTKEFEIITIWPYDNAMQLPGDKLIPKVGDKYILWNIRMPDEYYELAEAEFMSAVDKYNADHNLDISVYKAPTDHVWIEDNEVVLTIGQRIRLESDEYFPETGYRDSRITKITRKVNLPSSMDIEISDALSRTAQEKMADSIEDVRSYVKSIEGSINLPDIIRTGDTTKVTDNNLFSALRSLREFLSKRKDDAAEGLITFLQGLASEGLIKANAGATFGDFIEGLYAGKGARIDEHGNAELESLRVRSFMEVMELLVNRTEAVEGDQIYTEGDTVERVVDLGNGVYGLYLHSKYDGYFTAQAENNILKCVFNTLPAYAAGLDTDESTRTEKGEYYTSWVRVNSVDTAANYIEVTLYPDSEVPGGRNFPPCEMMNVARWGNQTDETRQRCFYISSTEGRIVFLRGVTKPIVDRSNYEVVIGRPPEFLKEEDPSISDERGYVYALGFYGESFNQITHQGKPIIYYVDSGEYVKGKEYHFEWYNAETRRYETWDVWRRGCKWRCCKDGITSAPSWNNTDWAMLEGNPYFTVEFDGTPATALNPNNFYLALNLRAILYNEDITSDILPTDITWERYSETIDGEERVELDEAWNEHQALAVNQQSLHLTPADIDYDGDSPSIVMFDAEVKLRRSADGGKPTVSDPIIASATVRHTITILRAGTDATAYYLTLSTNTVTRDKNGVPNPQYISIKAERRKGDGPIETMTDNDCHIRVIATDEDGNEDIQNSFSVNDQWEVDATVAETGQTHFCLVVDGKEVARQTVVIQEYVQPTPVYKLMLSTGAAVRNTDGGLTPSSVQLTLAKFLGDSEVEISYEEWEEISAAILYEKAFGGAGIEARKNPDKTFAPFTFPTDVKDSSNFTIELRRGQSLLANGTIPVIPLAEGVPGQGWQNCGQWQKDVNYFWDKEGDVPVRPYVWVPKPNSKGWETDTSLREYYYRDGLTGDCLNFNPATDSQNSIQRHWKKFGVNVIAMFSQLIQAEDIDTDRLVAKQVRVRDSQGKTLCSIDGDSGKVVVGDQDGDVPGQRVEIVPSTKSVNIFDEEGNQCVTLTGDRRGGTIEQYLLDEQTAVELPGLYSGYCYASYSNVLEGRMTTASTSEIIKAGTMLKVSGEIQIWQFMAGQNVPPNDTFRSATATATLSIEFIDPDTKEVLSHEAFPGLTLSTSGSNLVDDTKPVEKRVLVNRDCRVRFVMAYSLSGSGPDADNTGLPKSSGIFQAVNLTIDPVSDVYDATVFANGVLFSKSKENFVGIMETATGFVFQARALGHGIKVSKDGAALWNDALGVWSPQPISLLTARWYGASINGSYGVAICPNGYAFNLGRTSTSPSSKRGSIGRSPTESSKALITFPTEWNSHLDWDRVIVRVHTSAASTVVGNPYDVTTSYKGMTIQTFDSNGAAQTIGNLSVEILYIP